MRHKYKRTNAFSIMTHFLFASAKRPKQACLFNWLTKTDQTLILALAIAAYEKGLND